MSDLDFTGIRYVNTNTTGDLDQFVRDAYHAIPEDLMLARQYLRGQLRDEAEDRGFYAQMSCLSTIAIAGLAAWATHDVHMTSQLPSYTQAFHAFVHDPAQALPQAIGIAAMVMVTLGSAAEAAHLKFRSSRLYEVIKTLDDCLQQPQGKK